MSEVAPPERGLPDESDPHFALYRRVRQAVASLPSHFHTETFIAGVLATDLHTLNTVLGATIEDQVVSALNSIRDVWDPDETYALYSFVRQAQTFPDVVLRRPGNGEGTPEILLGVELKGWYLLAKEGMPNFRFTATPAACAPRDLIVVVPWALSQILSGRPMVLTPYIESAKYAAEYRNYWWQHVRRSTGDTTISPPSDAHPYPSKVEHIHDRPADDRGGNFGRFARTGIMDDYLEGMKDRPLAGVAISHWLTFFRALTEGRSQADVSGALESLARKLEEEYAPDAPLAKVVSALEELAQNSN